VSRAGAHGGATVAEVAAELGVHPNTVVKDTARALGHLELLITALMDDLGDPLLLCVQRVAFESYCARLMCCKPGDVPDDDPPCVCERESGLR
jgi:hypothetical protein